jgi:FAD:protein FMN transferase
VTEAIATAGSCRVEHIMGMAIVVDVRDRHVDEAAVDAAFDWFKFVDGTFSTFKPESEICRIDSGELALEDAHADVVEVLTRCDELREETDGYFDARACGRLDPSGLVKGWSVDRAAGMLEQAGGRNFAIYAGGDVAVRGRPLPEERWLVGIRHPRLADRVAAVVDPGGRAVATSGSYARGDHVLDPHTGIPAEGLASITLVGRDLATTDAFATAAFAMGLRGPEWVAGLEGYEAMAIFADETAVSTAGFPAVAA